MQTSLTVKDLLTGISALSISTNADLGSAATMATQLKRLFVDPSERPDVLTTLGDVKTRIDKSSLKKVNRDNALDAIDDAVQAIRAQPQTMPMQSNGAGTRTDGDRSGHHART